MKRTWLYFQNGILNAVENNFKKAVKISTYHNAALEERQGDPFFKDLFLAFSPYHATLIKAFAEWLKTGGIQKGGTLGFKQLLTLLSSSKINSWDVSIQVVYPKNTAEYKSILPSGRKPFQNGTYESRTNAVNALALALEGIAPLSAVKDDVDDFYKALIKARNRQLADKSEKSSDSDELRQAVVQMAIAQYSNMGACIQKFAANPTIAEPLFDEQTIRNHEQNIFTHELDGDEIFNILEHTFSATDELLLENTGETEIGFYLAPIHNAPPDKQGYLKLSAGFKKQVNASELGSLTNRFLMVINLEKTKGEMKVEL